MTRAIILWAGLTLACSLIGCNSVAPLPAEPLLSNVLDARLAYGMETRHVAKAVARYHDSPFANWFRLEEYVFEGVTPKRNIEGIFRAALDHEAMLETQGYRPPPDMLGTGPYIVIKAAGQFHALTAQNFARVFGPIENEKDVIPYLRAYGAEFLTVGQLVTDKRGPAGQAWGSDDEEAPELTTVRVAPNGYKVRLVYYTFMYQEQYFAIDVFLCPNGTVMETGGEVLKDLGGGIVF